MKGYEHNGPHDDVFEGKSFGDLLIEGLQEVSDTLKQDPASIGEKFNCHRISLDLEPTSYDADMVRGTRKLLGASQAVFAQFLGVSRKTVQSWEQGNRPPKDVACRLMDEIRHDPGYWLARIRELAVSKSPKSAKGCS